MLLMTVTSEEARKVLNVDSCNIKLTANCSIYVLICLLQMSSMSAKLFIFLILLLLPSSNCSEVRDGEQQKAIEEGSCIMRCNVAGDAHQIQLRFNHSDGKVSPIDLDASYHSYVAIRNHSSQNLPILCTVTNYETAFTAEIREVTRRTKATILCALPAKAATMRNESSASYMSRHMYEISRQIAGLLGNYQWLKPGTTVYEKSDRVSDLDIVTFNLNSRLPTQNAAGGIIQMAATLSFSTSRPLRYYTELSIAVPVRATPRQFVNTSSDYDGNHKETHITGFWIDFFKEAATMQAVNTTYKLVPFYGSEDQLLKAVARKDFDAAVGLTVITEERSQLVDFLCPYFEIGPVIVMKKKIELNQVFSFMRPFTNEMWLTMAFVTIFTAFVIWLVEHRSGNESGSDSPSRQVGAVFWFSFATLFYGGHKESPRKNLTYFVLAPWLFLILVVTSTYTASFTSMITSSETDQSSCLNIEELKTTNAMIGCDGDSILFRFIVEALGFQPKNIKTISLSSIDDYAKALLSGDIKAAFFLTPYAQVFLAKYCKGFSAWDPYRNLRGSLVVLPRGSPLASEMSEAILRVMHSGKFHQMKEEMLAFQDCSRSTTVDGTIKGGIGPRPFSGLFVLSGGASAIAMLITLIRLIKNHWDNCIQRMLMSRGLWVYLTTLFSQNHRRNELELSSISSTVHSNTT